MKGWILVYLKELEDAKNAVTNLIVGTNYEAFAKSIEEAKDIESLQEITHRISAAVKETLLKYGPGYRGSEFPLLFRLGSHFPTKRASNIKLCQASLFENNLSSSCKNIIPPLRLTIAEILSIS